MIYHKHEIITQVHDGKVVYIVTEYPDVQYTSLQQAKDSIDQKAK